MAKPDTQPVELTLEESGWLIHLLVRELLNIEERIKKGVPSVLVTPEILNRIRARMTHLHSKLSDANDKLMGKKHG